MHDISGFTASFVPFLNTFQDARRDYLFLKVVIFFLTRGLVLALPLS